MYQAMLFNAYQGQVQAMEVMANQADTQERMELRETLRDPSLSKSNEEDLELG